MSHKDCSHWDSTSPHGKPVWRRKDAPVRGAIKGGETIAAVGKSAAQSERMRWELFDEYNGRNATAAYAELEWE